MLFNQRGQAAIFIALMFNVLFVFFAMAINVALVVHDKINLQNSVDMAAYYAAMKQAELLNVIAHENYMIRQSWKLLTWRYRVIGTMGIDRNPKHPVWTGEESDSVYPPADKAPTICVTYKPTWKEVPEDENLCHTENLRIPALPEVKNVAPFFGINAGIAALSRQLRQQFDIQCQKHGAYNWWYAASILHAFRIDQRNRRQVITALAQTLSQGRGGDFVDLDGNSVLEGARQTFLKNLTFANRAAFQAQGGEFQVLNSLEGIDPRQWLVPIEVVPTLIYTDTQDNTSDCVANPRSVDNIPSGGKRELLSTPWPQGLGASELFQWAQSSFMRDSDWQFSIGFEKNPWYMPYVGVRAKTTPRQIFFPFGDGVEIIARSFAKPFGGRIGPWYNTRWAKGAPNSDGIATDPKMAPRMAAGGLMNSSDPSTRLPNYARYPGDTLGLASKMAINGVVGLGQLSLSYNYYQNIKADFEEGGENDILAFDQSPPEIRNLEIAALAPDLFDITYYSIEPAFNRNYLPRLVANRTALKIPPTTPLRPDLGFNGRSIQTFSVQQQMDVAKSKQKPNAFFYVREKAHLLTSWLPGEGAFNYDVNDAMKNFGKCLLPDDGLKFPNPGSCVAGGGRTGYSVKLINRDALLSNNHKIGGPNSPADSILNPPRGQGW